MQKETGWSLKERHAKGGCGPPFGIPQRPTLAVKSPWHYRVTAHPYVLRWPSSGANASGSRAETVVRPFGSAGDTPPYLRRDPAKRSRRIRKNEEADSVQTDSPHSASRASRKAPHPLLRFSSQNRNDVSVLKGRAAKRTSPRVYTGAASEAARCAPFPRQARKLRICSRLLPDPPESLRWIPSAMRGRERVHSDAASGSRAETVVRPFGSAHHTHPAPPGRRLNLRTGKEERGSGYRASPLAGEAEWNKSILIIPRRQAPFQAKD